jgi:hypothetical protein
MADRVRGTASRDQPRSVTRPLRVLTQDFRHRVRARCRLRPSDGFQVRRHWSELSRVLMPIQRRLMTYGLCARGKLLRRSPIRSAQSRAVVLPAPGRDGNAGHQIFGLLDYGQQQIDAGSGRLRLRRRRFRRDSLGQDHLSPVVWARFPHMLLGLISHGCLSRRSDGRLVPPARQFQAGVRIICASAFILQRSSCRRSSALDRGS